MKKLLILTIAVIATAFANAATVKWSASGVYAMNSSDKAGASFTAVFISSADYSYAQALADLTAKDTAFVDTYGQASSAFKDNTSGIGTGSAGATITDTAGNSETWTGYLVILGIVDGQKYAYLTSEVTKTTGATGGQAVLSWTTSSLAGTKDSSNWQAVPEPTTGLLMLIGFAGLALRRKQA